MRLDVKLIREPEYWYAQCLQHDIGAQGKTPRQAMERLRRTAVAEAMIDMQEGRAPFAGIEPAPQQYWGL